MSPFIRYSLSSFFSDDDTLPNIMRIKTRAAALILSLVGAAVNSFVAARVLSFWRVLKWETESEWEGSPDSWRVDSLKLVWLLVSAYFTTASIICVIGAVGVIKVRAIPACRFATRPPHYAIAHPLVCPPVS